MLCAAKQGNTNTTCRSQKNEWLNCPKNGFQIRHNYWAMGSRCDLYGPYCLPVLKFGCRFSLTWSTMNTLCAIAAHTAVDWIDRPIINWDLVQPNFVLSSRFKILQNISMMINHRIWTEHKRGTRADDTCGNWASSDIGKEKTWVTRNEQRPPSRFKFSTG